MFKRKNKLQLTFIFLIVIAALIFGQNQLQAIGGGCQQGYMCWHAAQCSGECWYWNCTTDICYNVPRINAECGVCVTT